VRTDRFHFIVAIAITLMNVWVAETDGPLLCHVWGDLPWPRVGLLALAGGGAITLMDIWSLSVTARSVLGSSMPMNEASIGAANSLESTDV
jgi:hypothetical protein